MCLPGIQTSAYAEHVVRPGPDPQVGKTTSPLILIDALALIVIVTRHVMSKGRRLGLFTAVNIDESASVSVPRCGDPWAFDGRIPEEAQVGTSFMRITTSIAAISCGAKIQTGVRPPA